MDHIMELSYKYCDRCEKELDDMLKKIEKAPTIAPQDVEIMCDLWRTIKAIKTVESMVDYDNRDGYSGKSIRMPSVHYDDYRYTRDSEKAEIVRMLEDKMRNVRSEDEAIVIRDAIDAINRLR